MKIGIDVDGVLTDLYSYQLKYGKKYFKNCENIDDTKIDIEDIFHCTKQEREKFWTKYIWQYCLKLPARETAAATIKKLKEEGHEIYIITSRAHVMEDNILGKIFRKMLFYWLDNEEIIYNDITLCHEKNSEIDKKEACIKYNIDIMVDDKYENVMELSKITKVLCYDTPYNRECNGENIIRVSNFNQIYDAVQKLSNQDYFEKLSREDLYLKTIEEKKEYFKKMKEYYQNLPYDIEKRKQQEINYEKLSKFAVPAFNLLFNPTVFNRELVPEENGLLFVANHNNYYDQFPIIAALGDYRPIHFLTATKMLALKRGNLYLKTGAISVNRESKNDRENASEEIKKILAHDSNAFIFPEGRTNRNEAFLLDFHPGAIAIAQAIGCKIVPIAVNDNYKKNDGDLCVRFGTPFIVLPTDDILEKTQYLKNIIGDLKQQNIDYVEQQNQKQKLKKYYHF